MRWMISLLAMACVSPALHAQQGRVLGLVVTTDDGDSIVEPGETATVVLKLELTPEPGQDLLGLLDATFDTIGGQNADTGSIVSFKCLNSLCADGDSTVTDGVSLFGTTVKQSPKDPGFVTDNPIALFAFTWQTNDFTSRTVRYSVSPLFVQALVDNEPFRVPVAESEIIFCVGACVEDVPPDVPFGLEHETLGEASFDVDDRGRLRVRGITDSGKDGFRVATGDAERHRVKIEPSAIGDGGELELSSLMPGTADGLELLTTRIEGGGDWSWFMSSEVDSIQEYEIIAFLGAARVYDMMCGQCSFEAMPFMKSPADVLCAVTPSYKIGPSRLVNIELDQPSTLSMFDGAEIVADRVEVRLVGFDPPQQTHTRVLATQITSLSIEEEQFGLFDLLFTSLDGALAMLDGPCPTCALTLGNIGATGDDGIEYDFEPATIFTTRTMTSQIELEPARIVSIDFADMGDEVLIETLTIEVESDVDALVALTPDFLGFGTGNSIVTAGLRSDGDLVQSVSGTIDNPPVLQVDGLVGPETQAAFIPKVKLNVVFEDESSVYDADGNLLGTFDAIEYTVSPQVFEPDAIVGARVTGTGAGFAVLDAVATPLCVADCDANGELNILDFVCYQTLFTMGYDAADCDDNGVLNILDFVCFQNAFVAGCD